jgi:nucleoside-diphosphate-sugar epimerase
MPTTPTQTILVTGAAGFIGSHLAGEFARRGARVVGVDNFDPFYPRAVKEANLAALRDAGTFEFVPGDITDAAGMATLFRRVRPTGVVHLAAKAGVRPSIADPVGYSHANVTGTSVILDAARAAGCGRVLVASSSSVYGNSRETPFRETQDVSEPISPYAATKRACELLGHAHHALTGMPTGMLRFFTVYGPRQRPDLAVAKFLRAVGAGEPVTLFGDGAMSRDYTYIDDIVAGILAAYEAIDRHGFRVWNLGGNHPVSLGDMVGVIERVVGRRAVIERAPMQPGDVLRTWADLTRARAELGYAPRTAFEEGVRRQWDWWRSSAGR